MPTHPDLDQLQKVLGYEFNDSELLQLAITHPSVGQDPDQIDQHNQRLEFLGDAVLQLVLTTELYLRYPSTSEGALTKARAQMVNRQALADQSKRINLGNHLILSKGEETTGGRERPSALADTYEAVLGAIYLDGGLEEASKFIVRCFTKELHQNFSARNAGNPKGELQELLQSKAKEPPIYEIVDVSGPDHDREFRCVVTHSGIALGEGVDKSKKAAESKAADKALQSLLDPELEAGASFHDSQPNQESPTTE
jgi:ribonuclease-3